ncbi:transposase [Streptomyces sp. NPDC059832]|uniref:transposase n=1 Tax=Streptomyces sp. NPDC059832 TaxID=3346966 RepID=UPI00364D5E60
MPPPAREGSSQDDSDDHAQRRTGCGVRRSGLPCGHDPGFAPFPASSGRTNRHRLSRGGDRGANAALYRIALVRMSSDARTREYVARQTAAGRTKKEFIRLLKRAIAREIFRYLTTPVTVPDVSDLRPARQAKNITLTAAAEHFGVWPAVISCIGRGTRRDDDLVRALPGPAHRDLTAPEADSLIDGGRLKGSGQEGPVPFLGELLPEVSIPARRGIHPRREGLKEVIKALVLPFVPPAEVVLVQLSDEGDQLVAAADLAGGSK